jgi:hypothetical protein
VWYLYGAAFPFLVLCALVLGIRTLPLIAGVPLLGVAGLSVSLVRSLSRRFMLIALGTSVLQVLLGVLLLGGPGTSVQIGGREFVDPTGVPALLQVPVLLLGVALPPFLVFYSLRALRMDASRFSALDGAADGAAAVDISAAVLPGSGDESRLQPRSPRSDIRP